MRFSRKLLFGLLVLGLGSAKAQVAMDMKLSRRSFMAYEPIVATVAITNLSGRDLLLEDAGADRWFSFQINTGSDQVVTPRNPNYQLSPLKVAAGDTVKRQIDLVSLYPVTDPGFYRIQASVYVAALQKYFSSTPLGIEVSEGRLIWNQTVGNPESQSGREVRDMSLLTFRRRQGNYLYARVENRTQGLVYATHPLGMLLDGNKPQVLLDSFNQLHVMHVAGPKTFLHTVIGLNGEWLSQDNYISTNTRPEMRKGTAGQIAIFGGRKDVPAQPLPDGVSVPKVSDRPADLPK